MSAIVKSSDSVETFPSSTCLSHCVKLAISDDRPIMLDYWQSSLDGTSLIGVREGGEKLLVKNEDEYTSPISKILKVDKEYIILTENSIYVVSSSIATKRIG